MAKRARYNDEFRASAVLMLEAAGYPGRDGALLHTSNHLGVPRSTLRSWFNGTHNPPPADVRHKKEIDLLVAIKSELSEIFPAMADRREDATYRELVTAAGILIDKLQLLSGKPTWRGEIIELLQEGAISPDDVKAELGDELATELFNAAGISSFKR